MTTHRWALRTLKRNPGFALALVSTLALGIGSAVLVFAVLESVVLRPLPYRDPEKLVFIWIDDAKRAVHEEGLGYPTYLDWKVRSKAFQDIAIRGRGYSATLTGGEPERVLVDVVSANYLPLLGIRPSYGRLFTTEDEDNGSLVTVISESLAKRRFGSPEAAAGKTIEMFGQIWRVVGIIAGDRNIPPARQEIWVPARKFPPLAQFMDKRTFDFFVGIGRLKSGVGYREAEAELDTIGEHLAEVYPINDTEFGGYGTRVVPFSEQIVGARLPRILWILMGAVGLVLLVACVNAANLLLARGSARRSELAVRAALGAGRGDLIRQQVIEGTVLALLGGAGGCVLAWLGLRLLPLIAPPNLPRFDNIAIDGPVLVFAIAASSVACVLFAAVPAWIQARRDPNEALRGTSARVTDGGAGRLQSALVVSEFAISLALLVAAGLFLRSFIAVASTPAGFETRGALLFQVDRDWTEPAATRRAFYRALLERLRSLPGVSAAGAITDFFIEKNPDYVVTVQGKATESNEQITVDPVSRGFLESVGAHLLRGRTLVDSDYIERPTAVVINETFAKRLFRGENPIGKYLKFGDAETEWPWIEVVGVVADLRRQGLEKRPVCEAFGPAFSPSMDIVVRASVPPETLVAAVRSAVRELDPALPVYGVTTLENRMSEFASDRRLQAWLLSGFSLLTLILGAVGIYGVTQYVVSQRRRDMAIRMALGADAGNIQRIVLRRGAFQAATGIVLGLLITLAATRVVGSLLYGVSALDPSTLLTASMVLAGVGIGGCWLPAYSAGKSDPAMLMKD